MLAVAMRAVLDSGDFVTSAAITGLVDLGAPSSVDEVSNWQREQAIFSISFRGEDYFPLYALQPREGFRPYRQIKEIIDIFGDKKDGWATALWFLTRNSYLDGRRPRDMIASDPVAVLAAAKEDVAAVLHGWQRATQCRAGASCQPAYPGATVLARVVYAPSLSAGFLSAGARRLPR